MLGKLIKYEFRAMGRIMLPVYLVMIALAGLFAVNLKLNIDGPAKTLLERFAIITGFLFAAAILAVFIVMVVMIILRFYRNLLGTEGYLMFTLPVTTAAHIISKLLTAVLWIAIGIGAGIIAGLLMVGVLSDVPEFLQELNSAWQMLVSGDNAALRVALIVILLIASVIESICQVYAAISIGQLAGNHRLACSVLAYIGLGVLELLLAMLLSKTPAGNALTLLTENSTAPTLQIRISLYQTLLRSAVYAVISWYLLDRHLNLSGTSGS